MRRLVLAVMLAGLAQAAQAADLPDLSDAPVLRGGFADGLSKTSVNWQGAYVGGQFGYSAANMDFSNATNSQTRTLLQNLALDSTVSGWTVLGKASPTSTGFGGFVGWNSQWDDVILGVEANYNRLANLSGSSSNTLPVINVPGGCLVPPAGDTDICGASVNGAASAKITDVLTLRGRAGWAIDNYLPYMFGGVALGRANIVTSATVTQTDQFYTAGPPPAADGSPITTIYSSTQVSNGVFTYGYTAGLGLEAMVWCGMFVRAEYEYVKFTSIKDININLNTVRFGLGYKF